MMRFRRGSARVSALAAAAVLALSAYARAENTSAYTTLDFDDGCTLVDGPAEGEPAGWVRLECEGYEGTPVHVFEDDLRMSLSYGGRPKEARWWDGFSGFSDVHPVIEWRLRANDGLQPFATIHRWRIDTRRWTADGVKGGERSILVLSTIAGETDDTSCALGYVDASLNADANRLARHAVDEDAADFTCDEDEPRWYGSASAASSRSLDKP